MQVSERGVGTELSVILPVRVANTTLEMVLDSGAGPSVIDLRTIRELGLERRIYRQVGKVHGVGQNPVHLVGNITLEIDLGDNQVSRHSFGVLHDTTAKTRILGRDLLKKFGSTQFDWESHRVRIGSVWKDTCAVLEGGDILLRSTVAALESSTGPQRCEITTVESHARGLQSVAVNPDLPENLKKKFVSLLNEFSDVFTDKPKSPTVTPNASHVIDTGDGLPVKHTQRRVSPRRKHRRREVNEMLKNGICRPSDSPSSSAIILATKKDGRTRFVVDYRALNDLTRKDAYPMPNPCDILDCLCSDSNFTSLDCVSAYWAVPIDERDRPKTALSTPRGHYEMIRMAFGLCYTQATYQRLMDNTLRGVPQAHSYVDDILVHLPSINSHVSSLRKALERLRAAKIQLRPDKCRIGYREIEFVGHIITSKGHRPLPSNVQKITACEPPKSKVELKDFWDSQISIGITFLIWQKSPNPSIGLL